MNKNFIKLSISVLVFILIGGLIFFTKFSSKESIPVVFIHKSNSNYLKHSLWQAKQYNKRVILIGDESNKGYPGIEHYNMNEFFDEAASFAKIYKHIAENSYQFELFCFQCWFLLKHIMDNLNIDVCFHCDSDVMLYCNVDEEYKHYKKGDCSIRFANNHASGEISYFSRKALTDFCNYLKNYYQNNKNIEKWVKWFLSPERPAGWGVCDMRIFLEWVNDIRQSKKPLYITDILEILDDSTYDHHIQSDHNGNYLMNNYKGLRIKNIKFNKRNQPYCYNLNLKKDIRFRCLHFQGAAKGLMAGYKKTNVC